MKNEKGITLAALAITIIILLILSTVAIYSGTNTIRYVKFNKAKSEIELMQSNVNSWNQEYKNGNNNVLYYGEDLNDSSCDSVALERTVDDTGINTSDYRFFSTKYIKENLGMDDSFEFLVNVKERDVILFNGFTYDDKMYYTTEDFGIYNVREDSSASLVEFSLERGTGKEIIITNLRFKNSIGRKVDISKFTVEYKKSYESDSSWNNVTDKLIKYTEDDETKYKFSVIDDGAFYVVRISNTDKNVTREASIAVETSGDIASTVETSPFLPDGAQITNNNLDTGLTIKDSNGNEWVWIEVPKSITAASSTSDEIEVALENYTVTGLLDGSTPKTGRYGATDTWYDGCGLTEGEYNEKKSIMLQSIKTYGGFYIGKYEAGYEIGSGELVRNYMNDENTTEHPITQTPVIKQNAYPYNYVRCSQSEKLSENLKTDSNTTTSLMFGIQWDLVLKHLSVKGGLTKAQIVSDSKDWGNFYNNTFAIDRGSYTYHGDFENWFQYTDEIDNIVQLQNGISTKIGTVLENRILLTTGAVDKNCVLNIYDLAGNIHEWTLEKFNNDTLPCTRRGGDYGNVSTTTVASRSNYGIINSYYHTGFRPAMYKN